MRGLSSFLLRHIRSDIVGFTLIFSQTAIAWAQ